MALPKKQKRIFLIIVISVAAIAWGVPELFWKKPEHGYGEEAVHGRRIFNFAIGVIEKSKESNGKYPDSFEPILSLFGNDLKQEMISLQPKYVVSPDKNSFELSFTCNDPEPVTCLWSSQKNNWAIAQ